MRVVKRMAIVCALVAGCGKSPQQLCEDGIKAGCAKIAACSMGSVSEADCEAMQKMTIDCSKAESSCPQGTKYNASSAQACADDYQKLSCDDIQNGVVPDACNSVCQ